MTKCPRCGELSTRCICTRRIIITDEYIKWNKKSEADKIRDIRLYHLSVLDHYEYGDDDSQVTRA